MKVFSRDDLGYGSVDIVPWKTPTISEAVLGSGYAESSMTSITIEAVDFIDSVAASVEPDVLKNILHFVRKAKYEELRERIGQLFPYCVVCDIKTKIFTNMKRKPALAIAALCDDNYAVIPLYKSSRYGRSRLELRGFKDKKSGAGRTWNARTSIITKDVFFRGKPIDDNDATYARYKRRALSMETQRGVRHALGCYEVVEDFKEFENDVVVAAAQRVLAAETGIGGTCEDS